MPASPVHLQPDTFQLHLLPWPPHFPAGRTTRQARPACVCTGMAGWRWQSCSTRHGLRACMPATQPLLDKLSGVRHISGAQGRQRCSAAAHCGALPLAGAPCYHRCARQETSACTCGNEPLRGADRRSGRAAAASIATSDCCCCYCLCEGRKCGRAAQFDTRPSYPPNHSLLSPPRMQAPDV